MSTRNIKRTADESSIEQMAAQQAREWALMLDSGTASAADRARFERWLALDHRHRQAYQEVRAILQGIGELEGLKDLESVSPAEPLGRGEENVRVMSSFAHLRAKFLLPQWGMAIAAALLVAVMVYSLRPVEPVRETYHTGLAENREITLQDGSVVALGPQTRLEVTYSAARRHVRLVSGEAFFDVTHNPERPFNVETAYTLITVLGTLFNVNALDRDVAVAVETGKVQVEGRNLPGRRDSLVRITDGQQVSVHVDKGMSRVETVEPEAIGSWRKGLRIYNASPLSEVLKDLQRYSEAEFVIADESLNSLSVTAVFPTTDAQLMLAALEEVLPVKLVKAGGGRLELKRKVKTLEPQMDTDIHR